MCPIFRCQCRCRCRCSCRCRWGAHSPTLPSPRAVTASMSSLVPLPPPNPSAGKPEKASLLNSTTFSRIPTWISLRSSSSSSSSSDGKFENLHLLSLSKQGKLTEAREFLRSMDSSGLPVKTHVFESLFAACGARISLNDARFFHGYLLKTTRGRKPDGPLGDSLLKMYFECGCSADARQAFDEMPTRTLASWTAMISGCGKNRLTKEAILLFFEMQAVSVRPDAVVLAALVHACSTSSDIRLCRQMHSYAIRIGMVSDAPVNDAIGGIYLKCGCLDSCAIVLIEAAEKSIISWTALMVAYTRSGRQAKVLELFDRMMQEGMELDQFVFSIAFKACSGSEDWDAGRQIHGFVIKLAMECEVAVGTPVVDFYVKYGSIDDARMAFDRISLPNEVSWSAIIAGYAQQGRYEESLNMFKYLRSRDMVLNPNIYTSIFQVSSALTDSNSGAQVHADAIKRGLVSNLYGESALISMYARSGNVEYARRAFESIVEPDTVAWTAIITGCGYHGRAPEALELFYKMLSCSVRPNSITFMGVLTACSHAGLVLEARQCLESMSSKYGVEPTVDHYNCMVDVYCRAGCLEEAFALIKSGSFKPDAMSWKILLSGCTAHRNPEIGKIAGENYLRAEPSDAAAYILTFNMYAAAGRWEEAASIRKIMSGKGIKKEVSCSWITVKGKVHRFIVGDRHHPLTEQIYSKMDELESSVMLAVSALPVNDGLNGQHEERMKQLLDHSEKLAIAFGIISTSATSPILIFKNLRVCGDCHSFTKLVSKITRREITVRDSTRFHHFKDGMCSCQDYW